MCNDASHDASYRTFLRRARALATYVETASTVGFPQPDAVTRLDERLGAWLYLPTPPAVTNLIASSVSPTTAALTWSPGAAGALFTVQYRVTGTTTWTTWADHTSVVGATITGLNEGYPYDFQVIEYDCSRCSTSQYVATAMSTSGPGYSVALYASTSWTAYQASAGNVALWNLPTASGILSETPILADPVLASYDVSTTGGYYVDFAEWVTAFFPVVSTGVYGFKGNADDGFQMYIDGVSTMGDWDDLGNVSTYVALSAGIHALDVRYFQEEGPYSLSLQWLPPGATSWTPLDSVVFQV